MLAKRHPTFMYAVVMSAQLKVKKQSWSLIERFPAAAWRAHSHAAMHAVIQWRTPTAFSASVSVSLGLFLDKLLWHCCGFSCPAFALCGQLPQHIAQWLCHRVRWTRIHWVRWNKIGEEASRMLKSWQTKTYGTDILYDYENILPNSVTKCSKHNFWPVIFSLWMQMSVSHAVNAVIVVDKNNIYVLINT